MFVFVLCVSMLLIFDWGDLLFLVRRMILTNAIVNYMTHFTMNSCTRFKLSLVTICARSTGHDKWLTHAALYRH